MHGPAMLNSFFWDDYNILALFVIFLSLLCNFARKLLCCNCVTVGCCSHLMYVNISMYEPA